MKPEDLNAAIDQWNELEAEIKKTLGWVDSWRLLPMVDERENYWMLAGGTYDNVMTGKGCQVVTSSEPFSRESVERGDVTGGPVYTQRGHDYWVFRVGDVVLIPVDTQCDGNILLLLLDAKKESTDPELRACYQTHWGSGV